MQDTGIERFDFHGDKLDVHRDGERVYVALRPMCQALGVDYSSQLQKLKAKAWATVVMIATVAEDGKARSMAMLHLDCVPMWLATIEASKVRPEARPKLTRFQVECFRVLRDHFLPSQPSTAAPEVAFLDPTRIGDDEVARRDVAEWSRVAAKMLGTSIQRIHGFVRKPHGATSIYRIAHLKLDHVKRTLQMLAKGEIVLAREATRPRPALPADRRQLDMWGAN